MMQFRVPRLGTLFLFGLSLLFALFCGEIFLRVVYPQVFDVHEKGMYIADPFLGYALKPGFAGVIERSEFQAPFTVNEAGFRGPEPRDRTKDTFRILVLGDSQAFGFGVLDDETFSVQLEGLLASRFQSLDVQVFNGGVPGYGTADELAFLKSRGATLRPDLVIVQFLSVNDIVESLSPAVQWAVVDDGWLVESEKSQVDVQAADDKDERVNLGEQIRRLKAKSHLVHLVSNGVGYIAVRLGLIDKVDALWGEDFSQDEAARTAELLIAIAQESRQLGAACVFLYTTAKNYVLSGDYELPKSAQMLRDAAERGQVPWIDATPFLRDRPDKTELFFILDGHWSVAGHRAIAELLADRLSELGLIDAGPEGRISL